MNAPRPLCLRVDSDEAFSETAFERYAYNNRSEVIGSQRFYGSDIDDLSRPVTGRTFGYGYDPIGNRVSSFEAATDATVTVNGNSAWRKSAYFVGVDDFDNVSSDVFAELATTAVRSTAEVDEIESSTGRKFLAQTLEISEYGDDGNMLSDGRYLDAWDGENRLVSLSERGVPTNRAARTVSFRYDPPGRLVSRTVSGGVFWLDHIVVLEETAVGGSVARTVNLWGGDVSETLGGAVGVGGLLSVSNGSGTFYPMFDESGNVSEYLDRSGDIAAHYEYSPFGETLVREGGRADEFAHRFSTKAVVPRTPLYYYGSRFYSPVTGRWLNSDPIRENGGLNLYAFIQNTPANAVDLFSYEIFYIGGAAEELVGTIDDVKELNLFDFVSTWDNPHRVIGEKRYRRRGKWMTKKIHTKDGEITEHINQFVQSNPCKPVILVEHSYGGDTAFDIAAELNGTPCLCLYIITLDAVSRFDSDVWYGGNPKDGTPVIEWINVYQENGWEDDLNATPVVGHITGALWAFSGLLTSLFAPDTGSDLIASGGEQWNENPGADINLSFKSSDISHGRLLDMLQLTIPRKGKSVWGYAKELNQRSCCGSVGGGNE